MAGWGIRAPGAQSLPWVAGQAMAAMAGLVRPRLPDARVLLASACAATALGRVLGPHGARVSARAGQPQPGVHLLVTPGLRAPMCCTPVLRASGRPAQQGQAWRADRDNRAGRVDGRVRRDARRHPRPRAVHGRGGAGRAPAGRAHQRAHRVRAGRPALHRVWAARLVDRRARVGQRCLPARRSVSESARPAVHRV